MIIQGFVFEMRSRMNDCDHRISCTFLAGKDALPASSTAITLFVSTSKFLHEKIANKPTVFV